MTAGGIAIYGATGYIGALTARVARERGLRPVLMGRDRAALAALGTDLDLPTRAGALDRPAEVDALLDGVAVVLNAAGPFAVTAGPGVTLRDLPDAR